jgi:hypothetical protein
MTGHIFYSIFLLFLKTSSHNMESLGANILSLSVAALTLEVAALFAKSERLKIHG